MVFDGIVGWSVVCDGVVMAWSVFCDGVVGQSVIVTFPGLEVIKHISCSTQLSTKFHLLTKNKIPTNKEVICFKSLRSCIYAANKC